MTYAVIVMSRVLTVNPYGFTVRTRDITITA
jgi:hypothetical protein